VCYFSCDWLAQAAPQVAAGDGLTTTIRIKRIYEDVDPKDGVRILVDRLWPRGIAKQTAQINHWMKDLAPSHELRQRFDHDPVKWDEFRKRYATELAANPLIEKLKAMRGTITLVYSARDEEHNQAVALKEYLAKH
jgi:uncharacterized protein YeaO (DUF488 family)